MSIRRPAAAGVCLPLSEALSWIGRKGAVSWRVRTRIGLAGKHGYVYCDRLSEKELLNTYSVRRGRRIVRSNSVRVAEIAETPVQPYSVEQANARRTHRDGATDADETPSKEPPGRNEQVCKCAVLLRIYGTMLHAQALVRMSAPFRRQ